MAEISWRARRERRSIAPILLAASVALGLAACGERPAVPPVSENRTTAPEPTGDEGDSDTYAIGLEAGREQGYADGHEEGFDEGHDKGLEEGRDEGRSEALECVRQQATASAAEAADLCE